MKFNFINTSEGIQKFYGPRWGSLIIAVSILIFEFINMLILGKTNFSRHVEVTIYAVLLILEMIPTLYFFAYRPLTSLLNKELNQAQRRKQQIFKVYSDVLYAMTQGKINLLEADQIAALRREGELLGQIALKHSEDVNNARELMDRILHKHRVEKKDRYHITLCVSEAATNVIKHAYSGYLEIRKLAGCLRVYIADYGPGMDLEKLPKAVFLQGFSTKNSMGVGFTIMNNYSEKLYLSPHDEGTVLVLDFKI